MAVREDTSKIKVVIDNQQAINALGAQELKAQTLRKDLRGLKSDVAEYNKALRTINSKKVDENSKAYKKAQETVKRLSGSVEEFNKKSAELDKTNERIGEMRKQLGLAGQTLAQLTRRQRELNRELRNLTPGTKRYRELKEELQATNKAIKNQRSDLKGIGKETATVSGLGGAFSKLTGGVKSLISPVNLGAAALGFLTTKGLELEKQFTKLRSEVERFSGLEGGALSNATSQVKALADTFGKDFNEVIQAATTLSTQLGVDFNESLNLIEKGFLKGADTRGNFLEDIKEYAVQFNQAGSNAEEFIKIATQQAVGGVFNDKLLDTVKELGLRLRELTPAAQKALKPLGDDFVNETLKKLQTGEKGVIETFKAIIAESKRLGLSVQQTQTIIADLGAGPLEDLGGLEEAFKQLDAAMQINLETTDELGTRQKELIDSQKALNIELDQLTQNFEGSSNAITVFFNNVQTAAAAAVNATLRFFDIADARVNKFRADNAERIAGLSEEQLLKDLETERANLVKFEKQLQTLADQGFVDSVITELTSVVDKGVIEELLQTSQARIDLIKEEISNRGKARQQAEAQKKIEEERLKNMKLQKALRTTPEKETGVPKVSDFDKTLKEFQAFQDKVTQISVDAQTKRDEKGDPFAALDAQFAALQAKNKELIDKALKNEKLTNEQKLELQRQFETEQIIILQEFGVQRAAKQAELDEQEKQQKLAFKKQIEEELKTFAIENATTEEERMTLMRAKEIEDTKAHFEELTKLAKENGLETAAIKEAEEQTIANIEKKFREERLQADLAQIEAQRQIANDFISLTASAATIIGAQGTELQNFQSFLTLSQIAIDTAAAISSLVKFSQANPANAITGGAAGITQFISGLAQILGNVARAKKILSGADTPTAPTFTAKKLEDGGKLSGPSHKEGGIKAFVRKMGLIEMEGGEYVANKKATATNISALETINSDAGRTRFTLVPSYQISTPIPNIAAYEKATRFFQQGGAIPSASPTTPTETTTTNQTEMASKEIVNEIKALKMALMRTPLRAFIAQNSFDAQVKLMNENERINEEGNL